MNQEAKTALSDNGVSIEPPMVLTSPDELTWTDTTDFVVVGYGGAGVSAAVQAAEDGLKVIAIDSFAGGGATAMNGGIFYAGGGTAVQQELGIQDTADDMYNYLKLEVGDVVKPETLRRFCDGSVDDFNWLMKHGVKFGNTYYPHKTFYPPSGYFLYHSDSGLAATYAAQTPSVPRGHKYWHVANNQATGFGVYLTEPLQKKAQLLGVTFWPRTEARRLIMSATGEVLGVAVLRMPDGSEHTEAYAKAQETARTLLQKLPSSMPGFSKLEAKAEPYWEQARQLQEQHGVWHFVRAVKGVCLSAGGFIWNRKMLQANAPKYVSNMAMGSPGGDNGSGIMLGWSVGGATAMMERVSSWRFINPPAQWPKGLLVNGDGKRFVNEELYGAAIGREMNEHHGGRGYIILDRTLYRQSWKSAVWENLFPFMRLPLILALLLQTKKGKNLGVLARKIGVSEENLRASVKCYNESAQGYAPDEFGKSAKECHPILEGPFYAVDVSANSKLFPCSAMTVGGLRVNEETGQVLREDGSSIVGLYAAGRTAIGLPSNLYVSGLSAADCVFSGRRAARHASAAEV
jgi:3-oxo-5alpha-steroid 4-dehydrogenase